MSGCDIESSFTVIFIITKYYMTMNELKKKTKNYYKKVAKEFYNKL